MSSSFRRAVSGLALFGVVSGCEPASEVFDPSLGPPALVNANAVVATTVGEALIYDPTKGGSTFSDPTGRGLSYSVTLAGPAVGLQAIEGRIIGVPALSGVAVATVTATDARGQSAVDRFPIVIFSAGLPTPRAAATTFRYTDASAPLPAHFRAVVGGSSVAATDNTPASNPITDAGAALGRVLFYDPRLSENDVTPCSSCHIRSLGFSDALQFSVGFAGGETGRHAPGLANARFYKPGRFFWDERAATLEDQVLGPIQNPVEMGMALDTLLLKLRATPFYAPLFTAAFGTPEITSGRVARALAQFVRSFTSGTSRYDRAFDANGVASFAAVFTAQEQQGELLFRSTGCDKCHTTVAQVSDAAHNTGLDAVNVDVGTGQGAVKVPSLRNVAVRPRYMHDGRFASLDEVVEFYNSGVKANPNLDALLKASDGTPKRLGLTAAQKLAMVAFLKTLTDSTFLADPRFSDPFAEETPAPPPPAAGSAAITIQGNAYRPNALTVAPGTTIVFTNLDNRRHGATFASSAIVSASIFTSGSQSVRMPLTPGVYNFQCPVHGAKMSGVITVQ